MKRELSREPRSVGLAASKWLMAERYSWTKWANSCPTTSACRPATCLARSGGWWNFLPQTENDRVWAASVKQGPAWPESCAVVQSAQRFVGTERFGYAHVLRKRRYWADCITNIDWRRRWRSGANISGPQLARSPEGSVWRNECVCGRLCREVEPNDGDAKKKPCCERVFAQLCSRPGYSCLIAVSGSILDAPLAGM